MLLKVCSTESEMVQKQPAVWIRMRSKQSQVRQRLVRHRQVRDGLPSKPGCGRPLRLPDLCAEWTAEGPGHRPAGAAQRPPPPGCSFCQTGVTDPSSLGAPALHVPATPACIVTADFGCEIKRDRSHQQQVKESKLPNDCICLYLSSRVNMSSFKCCFPQPPKLGKWSRQSQRTWTMSCE